MAVVHTHASAASSSSSSSATAPPGGAASSSSSPPPSASAPPAAVNDVLKLVQRDFLLWKDCAAIASLSPESFSIKPLTGGSSNTLWLAQLTDQAKQSVRASSSSGSLPPLAVVVRFYGSSLDTLIERRSEAEVAEMLSQAGIGARILHHFQSPSQGRIEELIPGRTLHYNELGFDHISVPIAQEMARLHCTPLSGAAAAKSTPVVFENLWRYFHVALTARSDAGLDVPFNAHSTSALTDLFSLDAQNALFASLSFPSSADAEKEGWTPDRIASEINLVDGGDVEKLPKFITDNQWYKEIRWLCDLLRNWNDIEPLQQHKQQSKDEGETVPAGAGPSAPSSGKKGKKGKAAAAAAAAASSSSSSSSAPSRSVQHQRFLAECTAFSQAGLCHNDLNPGNVLYCEDGEPADSSSSSPAPPRFTLIDFEYAALNLPAFDLANTTAERCLNYAGGHWPFFEVHQRCFPDQEAMMATTRAYAEEKSKVLKLSAQPKPHQIAHLYVSTLTALMASHMLWALWGIIQSAGVNHSTAAHPSWSLQPQSDGSLAPFRVPPLSFLEYTESRWELYRSLKSLWLSANYVPASQQFPAPPVWQAMDSAADWGKWMEQIDDVHGAMRNLQLKATKRQQEALARFAQGYTHRGELCPWKHQQH